MGMTDLHTKHIRIDSTSDGLVIEPEYVDFLRTQGYTIEGVNDIACVKSNSRDVQHLVVKVDTYEYPINHPELDFEKHQVTIPVCSCEGYRYQYSADVSKHNVSPTDSKACPHIKQVDKIAKAKADNMQESLLDTE